MRNEQCGKIRNGEFEEGTLSPFRDEKTEEKKDKTYYIHGKDLNDDWGQSFE